MKRWCRLIALLSCALALLGCAPKEAQTNSKDKRSIQSFPYTHYASGGQSEAYEAVILMEEHNSTFTAYQVAFSSCTCRDSLSNFSSVAYVEILNTRENGDEAAIRSITFGDNRGLWGDSNPNYYVAEYTEEYYDENFVQKLVRMRKADFDRWEGYGDTLENLDAIAGATVSTSNITSMLKSLMAYHAEKYYEN